MAAHFPSAAAALFNIQPQASRDIKVSSWLLGKSPMAYQCSTTRYSFMWRQAELQELEARGYQLWQVELLADQNMRFMYICRAAQQVCACVCAYVRGAARTGRSSASQPSVCARVLGAQGCGVEDLLELMDLGLLGQNIADLVSSGAKLDDVRDALERVSH